MRKHKKVLTIIALVVGGIIVILYMLYPAAIGIAASTRGPTGSDTPPDGFETITFTTGDGIELSAWYTAPDNGAVILLLHGSHCNKDSLTGYAQMLRSHGYGVLALDLRGHGNSGGSGNALGWECGRDLKAAIDYLKTLDGIDHIGALGLSMGGEILLSAASTYPEISAIVSDGATHHTLADYLTLPENKSLWRNWSTRVMHFSTGLLTGQHPPDVTISDSVSDGGNTQFLLIAAGLVADEQAFNTMYLDAAAGRAVLWTVPDAGHTQAFTMYPAEYEQRITEFFDTVLPTED